MRTGVDLISVKRFERVMAKHGSRFLGSIFTEEELAVCCGDPRRLAGRFAAKEAVSKALGTGIGREGVRFRDIEIRSGRDGAPEVTLHSAARALYQKRGGRSLSLSISHENEYALAFCILDTVPGLKGEAEDD